MSRKPELLAPAGSLEVLKTAFLYGADAVYIGGEQYGLRAKAKNFPEEDMRLGIRYAHELGKKVYVTANITAHDRDLSGVRAYFSSLPELEPDALIISDPGVFMTAREVCPDIDIHVSTQANNVNSMTCRFWQEQGAARVVTARELSLTEIAEICAQTPGLEIETFVHGAMCISHSGRCLLSHYFTGRDANLGACTHPCRWRYYVAEETRPGEYLPVEENERGTYIFNSRDLCMIGHVPELIRAGIDSFKIEGRMKTALYVGSVVRAYRQAIDAFVDSGEEAYRAHTEYYEDEVKMCTYRSFTTGFFFGATDRDSQIYDSNTYEKGAIYLGRLEETDANGIQWLIQKNKFAVGDTVEWMLPSGENQSVTVEAMTDADGNAIESCPHPGQRFGIRTGVTVPEGTLLRKRASRAEVNEWETTEQ